MKPRIGWVCPGCKHASPDHIGGFWSARVGGFGDFRTHGYCGWVNLSFGNRWQLEPGWYRGHDLNSHGQTLPEGERPFLMFP